MKKILGSRIFILGLLLRFLLMPFVGHYDIRGINFAVYNLPFKHQLDIYNIACCQPVDYLVKVNFGREYFIYPPLTYFTLGVFQWLLKPFYGQEFVTWIQGWGSDVKKVLTYPYVFRYLFLMKLPYLVFDFLMLLLLTQFFTRQLDKRKILLFWWLNPIVLYLPYMWGQFDIIPTFFTLLSVYLLAKNKKELGAIILGIAAAYKSYPLMFIPFLLLTSADNLKSSLKLLLLSLAPFVLTVVPFIGNSFFRKTVLFSWQSQKMLDFMWGIGGHDGVYPFVIGYGLILLLTTQYLRHKPNKLHLPLISSLMWYYGTVNFHHQWFMWVLPFLVIVFVKNTSYLAPHALWILGLWFWRLLIIQANVTLELFVWLDPLFSDLPKTRSLFGKLYDINRMRNIVNSFFTATALWLSAYLFTQELPNKKGVLI